MNRAKIVLSIFFALVCFCNINPIQVEAGFISVKQEVEMGQQASKELEKEYGLVEDIEMQQRVSNIGNRLVGASGRTELPFTFKVLKNKEINALALPGGPVYLFQGLIDYMQTDEELAGVIAHEIGHIAKRHTVKQIEKNMGMTLLMIAAFGGKGVELQSLILNAISAGYSREDEREADKLGFTYIIQSGGNPYSSLMGMKKIKALEGDHVSNYGLFSDHPETDERISLLQGYLKAANVHPRVEIEGQTAKIKEENWELPILAVSDQNITPIYRSYIAAGALWSVIQTKDFDANKFILYTMGEQVSVMYDDRVILNVTSDDAAYYNTSIEDMAGIYLYRIKLWAEAIMQEKK